LARLKKLWLTVIALIVALFEILAVLILRAHYTMDVFTGVLAALLVASFLERLSAPIDRLLARPPEPKPR